MAVDDSPIGRLRGMLLGATVTQPFGCTGYSGEGPGGWAGHPECAHFHSGVDLALAGGTKANVYSPASGRVIRVDTNPSVGYGYSVRILDPRGFTYILGHFSLPPRVAVGQYVSAGDVLGTQGSTGNSSGVHLHLEVRNAQNVPINPAQTSGGVVSGLPKPEDVFYTLAHILGFGSGPSNASIQQPPDPSTGIVPQGGTTGGGGSGGVTGGGTGTTGGTGQRDCGPFPTNPLDIPAWYACQSANAVGSALGGLNPFAQYSATVFNPGFWGTNILPVAVVGLAGAVLVIFGLRGLAHEQDLQPVVQPVRDARTGAEGAARTGASVVATAAGAPEAAAVIQAKGLGAKAKTVANQKQAQREARAAEEARAAAAEARAKAAAEKKAEAAKAKAAKKPAKASAA